ncbi:MAG: Xaa-Pro peptidase family protein [Chloroflexota bacterium]|nr:Xaa-Pro peptidase family protein [Chloroflexota bacterium]
MNRIANMLELAAAQHLDAVALVPGPNLFYLTGLSFHLSERPTIALFTANQPPALILPALEAGKGTGFTLFPYTDAAGYAAAFQQAAAELQLAGARIGVESQRMRLWEARILERHAPQVQLLPVDELLSAQRMNKEPQEVAAMRHAVQVAEDAFRAWLPQLHVGMTEKEAAARLIAALLTGGAEGLAFNPIVAGGPNGALPHAVAGDRPFQTGDWIVVDWGAKVSGYDSDITRMVTCGAPTGKLVEIHRLVCQANAAGRDAVRPGATAGQVDATTRAVIKAAGYGPEFMHRTGHGLGLEAHEPPYIMADSETILTPGMTFTVEPGIYLAGWGGIRIEDDVLVSAEGVQTLTTLPREPFAI